ncbi:MAG: hypothetical protein FJZ59_05850 [Chlamydiae bacterium]|nr:hypothetical protein [Chlamydiota bacterium]
MINICYEHSLYQAGFVIGAATAACWNVAPAGIRREITMLSFLAEENFVYYCADDSTYSNRIANKFTIVGGFLVGLASFHLTIRVAKTTFQAVINDGI